MGRFRTVAPPVAFHLPGFPTKWEWMRLIEGIDSRARRRCDSCVPWINKLMSCMGRWRIRKTGVTHEVKMRRRTEFLIHFFVVRPDFQTFEKSFERYTISLRWHLSRLSTMKPKEFLHTVEKSIDIGLKKQQSQRQSWQADFFPPWSQEMKRFSCLLHGNQMKDDCGSCHVKHSLNPINLSSRAEP